MDTSFGDIYSNEYEGMMGKEDSFSGELKWRSISSCLFSTSWKNAFCIIHRGRFYVYKNQFSTPPNKVFNLRAVEVYENHQIPYCFEVKTTGDDCQFVATSESSKKSWMKALNFNKNNRQCSEESDYEVPDNYGYVHLEMGRRQGSFKDLKSFAEQSLSSSQSLQKQKTASKGRQGSFKDLKSFAEQSLSSSQSLQKQKTASKDFTVSSFSLPMVHSPSRPCQSKFEKAFWPGEAEKAQRILLYIKTNGTFLIRASSTCDPFLKTLLVMHNGSILKYPLSTSKKGKCILSGQEFLNGDDLIEHFTKNSLPGEIPVKLTKPYYDASLRDKS